MKGRQAGWLEDRRAGRREKDTICKIKGLNPNKLF
jgi:hypothetical protein